MNIGFIGLGNMGLPMAINLINVGHHVIGFDLNAESMQALVKAKGKSASNVDELAPHAPIIISMLQTGEQVKSVYLGENGLIKKLAKGTLIIDCSTIDVESTKQVASAANLHHCHFVDAPVSGGVAGAHAATLTFMIGGTDTAVERAKLVLTNMGKHLLQAGEVGAGQIAKACNNMLLAVHMIGSCEALQLGIRNGLAPDVLNQIMKNASGDNWTLQNYNPCPELAEGKPASQQYQGGFSVNLMLKDLSLAEKAGSQANASMPMGSLAKQLFALHQKSGMGQLDFSSIYKFFED